jgi:hypothetical protein
VANYKRYLRGKKQIHSQKKDEGTAHKRCLKLTKHGKGVKVIYTKSTKNNGAR